MSEVVLGRNILEHVVPLGQSSSIDIGVGNYNFTIAGPEAMAAQHGDVWNRPVLFESNRYTADSELGYKGLHHKQQMLVGSSRAAQATLSERFPWLQNAADLAPTHVAFSLRPEERVQFRHMVAGGVTRLTVRRPDCAASYKKLEDDLGSLEKFCSQLPLLDKGPDPLMRQWLSKQLYGRWYSKSKNSELYDDTPSQTILDQMFNRDRFPGDSYYRFGPKGRISVEAAHGSLYANVVTRELPKVAELLYESLATHANNIPFKVNGNAEGATHRADNLVMYARPNDIRTAVEKLAALQEAEPYAFYDDAPLLTAPVQTQEGQVLRGVGFGQGPESTRPELPGMSFGQSRCFMLAEMILGGARQAADFQQLLAHAYTAQRHDVYPIPALNARNGHLFDHVLA